MDPRIRRVLVPSMLVAATIGTAAPAVAQEPTVRDPDLAVRTDPLDAPSGGYLEVWLINEDLQRMVSVGVLRPGVADQSFTIPQELLDEGYVIVDISREGFDASPEHSGDSIVRGALAT